MPPSEPSPIPPMTHPYSRYWDQPSRAEILVDATHALMTRRTFLILLEYSASVPTGVYAGKMWRAYHGRGLWWLCWYGVAEDPEYCTIERRLILLIDDEAHDVSL